MESNYAKVRLLRGSVAQCGAERAYQEDGPRRSMFPFVQDQESVSNDRSEWMLVIPAPCLHLGLPFLFSEGIPVYELL